MLNKASINDDGDRHYQQQQQKQQQPLLILGDILLHCESKLVTIQVVTQTSRTTSPLTYEKPIIHRLSANSTGTNNSQTLVPCDLKNALPIKVTSERTKSTLSTKKLVRMQKAGVALVKEFKSKVVNGNHSESKAITVHEDSNREQTKF
ncbi:hypothetical protein I4U23_026270 [Adineta vaga]|nr:hypothetical protein I4U23_026270 [Adineta vaga]